MRIAHTRNGNVHEIQSVYEHNLNVANLSETTCGIQGLKSICFLAGLYHDAGKYKVDFQDYIIKSTENPSSTYRGEVTHSTDGAYLFTKCMEKNLSPIPGLIMELVRHAIISHHGSSDCISNDGEIVYKKRVIADAQREEVSRIFYTENEIEVIESKIKESISCMSELVKQILAFVRSGKKGEYGSRHFYFGCCERMILSCLIHADRTDTMCFNQMIELPKQMVPKEQEQVWSKLQTSFDTYIGKLDSSSLLNQCRYDISEQCLQAGNQNSKIYRLVVPTGAGKTLSSLRYALQHAKKYQKKHIFYIAPYHSILEQNANVIREVLKNDDVVLEHHCNIVSEEERYLQLTQTWESPIILTTAVQFLDTLFSSKLSSVRRYHTLADSIIIVDEVQATPIRCTKLFNLAMNFLNNFANTSILLCSATMPLLDELRSKRLQTPSNLVNIKPEYKKAFQRSNIVDHTELVPGGFSYRQAADYIIRQSLEARNMLVIVNTKETAKELYRMVKEYYEERVEEQTVILYHLSTNMCAAHRNNQLNQMMSDIKEGEKVICISTQLIEAGVDVSFQYVVRSLSGLDSIIQAAGRCNRSHEYAYGVVSIIHIKDEKVESLIDIVQAQESMKLILHHYSTNAECLEGDLASEKAIDLYYRYYFNRREDEMEYNVSDPETTIVELLSENRKQAEIMNEMEKRYLLLKQAFKKAGDRFEVIPEDGTIDIIVEYDTESSKLIQSIYNQEYYGSNYKQLDYEIARSLIRKLQPYTVSVSKATQRKIGNAIVADKELGVLILREQYYNKEIGVSEIPNLMEDMLY